MAITAKVRNKQIDTGKVLHALVQGEHASGNITFQIIGEEELVEDFNSTYFYLLYTRPGDTRPNVLLLTNKQLQDDVISVTFKPTSYFTAQDGTVQIQIMATDTEGLSIDSETGTISGSVIWQTFPGAMFVHASQLTGTETIIEENVLTQYLAGMQELNTQTEQAATEAQQAAVDAGEDAEAAAGSATAAQNAKTDAEAARDKAQEWATKSDGKVDNIDYSSKHYASEAKASEQKASEWAEKDTPVETGKYSAKHWAEQAHAEFNALDTYVDETLKPALDDYEETKEGELDTYTATKKAELDTYEDSKETELNTYTGTKKTELDTYTGAKKSELDSYVANTNKPALDSYTNNTLKPALLAYEQTQEGTLNTYTGTKKTELDTYVENTSKPSIDDYIEDEKKPEIDAYIAEQAGQFGADVTTLKGNVSALDKRVSNLEESLDVITEIEYPHATYGTGEVPPNKSKYAEVSMLRGVTRAWNQLISSNIPSRTSADVTLTNNGDGSYTLNGTASATAIFEMNNGTILNHAYLFCVIGAKKSFLEIQGWSATRTTLGVYKNTYSTNPIALRVLGGDTCDNEKVWPIARDLTLMFPEYTADEIVSLGVAGLVAICPDLLKYDEYGYSLVDTTYSAVKSKGVNLFDGVVEGGEISSATGANATGANATGTGGRCENYVPIVPSGTYYILSSVALYYRFYDISGNYIGYFDANSNNRGNNTSFVAPANAYRFRFATDNPITTDIQICLDSYSDKTNFHEYMTDTLTLPSPVTLKGAGSVADTDELNVKVDGVERRRQTRRTNEADLGQCDWYYDFDYSVMRTDSLTDMSIADNWSALICAKYTVVNSNTPYAYMPDKSCKRQSITANFVIKDSDLTESDIVNNKIAKLLGTKLAYETATYSVTLLDPIPDPFIQVEGGGTIKPVQTNEPEIDSAMTVTYVNKITA